MAMDCEWCGGRTLAPRTICTRCSTAEADRATDLLRLHLASCRTCLRDLAMALSFDPTDRNPRSLLGCAEGKRIAREARDWRIVAGHLRRGA